MFYKLLNFFQIGGLLYGGNRPNVRSNQLMKPKKRKFNIYVKQEEKKIENITPGDKIYIQMNEEIKYVTVIHMDWDSKTLFFRFKDGRKHKTQSGQFKGKDATIEILKNHIIYTKGNYESTSVKNAAKKAMKKIDLYKIKAKLGRKLKNSNDKGGRN